MIKYIPFLLLLTACFGEPVLDTSSEVALKESSHRIEKNLKGEELEKFRINIQYLEGEDYKKIAHGKTAKELDKIITQDLKEFNIRLIKSYINDLNEKETNNNRIYRDWETLAKPKTKNTPNPQHTIHTNTKITPTISTPPTNMHNVDYSTFKSTPLSIPPPLSDDQ